MKHLEIAKRFKDMADLLEIKGDNPYKIRAYRKAAFLLETSSQDIASMTTEELKALPGIGADLAAKIREFVETGRIGAYEALTKELPESIVSILGVPGVGPKTAALLYRKFGVSDIDGLERLARKHRLASVPGIKEKTENAILKGIAMLRRYADRRPLGAVLPRAREIREFLLDHARADEVVIAGSLRRMRETVRDIDIIASASDPGFVMKAFLGMPGVVERLEHGPTKSSALIEGGIQVDLRVVGRNSLGAALAYFTGSKAHNIRLRELARKKRLRLNEYGLSREKDGRVVAGTTEEEIYEALGLQYVPPELREDTGEIEAAQNHALPRLVEEGDIRGDLHVHSSWSDGTLEIDELIRRPIAKGYRYVLLTDHTRGPGVPRGLDADKVLEQKKRIDAVNRRVRGFRLLAGVESNIGNDGSLDLDDEVLAKLDLVVASVHSGFSQPRERITARLVAAMRNPLVSIIGHPTGRLLGERDPYEVDMDVFLRTAAETGTAVEINAFPFRLDLGEPHVRTAKQYGVPIVISTDSHTEGQFDTMSYGVAVARRGWLEKADVLNTLPLRQLIRRLRPSSGVKLTSKKV